MTEQPTTTEPLATHEISRLLRAFHSNVTTNETFSFKCKATVRNTMEFTYECQGQHHRLEVGDDFITHTMRYGVTEVKTELRADKGSGQITLKRQRRDFDFGRSELGEPVDVPIENLLQENHDLNHMAHVAMRTAQTIQSKSSSAVR